MFTRAVTGRPDFFEERVRPDSLEIAFDSFLCSLSFYPRGGGVNRSCHTTHFSLRSPGTGERNATFGWRLLL